MAGAHGSRLARMGMYTGSAWRGVLALDEYARLVAAMAEDERGCAQCRRNRRLLEQVWQTVANEYYDQYGSYSQARWAGELARTLREGGGGGPLWTKGQTFAAVKAMVDTLGDRYSAYLTPPQYRLAIHRPLPSEVKYLAYQYTGVGMELPGSGLAPSRQPKLTLLSWRRRWPRRQLGQRSPLGGLVITAPFAGSPAEEGGIVGGERLLAIDGVGVGELTADEAVTLLRGPVGSTVEVFVAPLGGGPTRAVVLERRALPLPPLRVRVIEGPGGRAVEYIRLHYFTHKAAVDMAAAIKRGESLGVDGYFIDVRNNPGGVFEEAIGMAALWLDCPECDVAETVRSSAGNEDNLYRVGHLPEEIFPEHPGALTHAPLALIANRSRASASEVLLGALRDNHRAAAVIGERTFGKGVVQYFFPMDDGGGLKLTVAKYLTPARYDISKRGGLRPDVPCSDHPRRGGDDRCIALALEALQTTTSDGNGSRARQQGPLPYRWLPSSDSPRLWAASEASS
eukprot:SM000332S12452  [mRNA]  locus=s332:56334:60509:- [translate_table: standard]